MKAIVTGGAGFIGSHLTDRLLANGHDVLVLDSLTSGRSSNLDAHRDNPRLSLHKVDVAEYASIEGHFAGVDWVFHLAAIADVVPSIQEPLRYHRTNVDGTAAVLEASRQAGVKRFVYAASSSCYGLADQFPTPETAPIRTMYPYALTKYVGEQYVFHWESVYQLPCVSLRFFNVYGPRSRTTGAYGAVFGVFLAQKLAGKPFTVVGDGEQTRDFVFVTDVADCLVRAAQSPVSGRVFNVASGAPKSVNYLAGLLGGEVVHLPKRPGEPDQTFADITQAKTVLGWEPKVGFEEGVAIMLENIQSWNDAPVWDQDSISHVTQDWFKYLGDGAGARA